MTGGSNSSSQMSNSRKTENMKKPDPISSAIITLSSLFFLFTRTGRGDAVEYFNKAKRKRGPFIK